ncbi:MAG: helix-turn-helix domain-containing protein [Marinoscillum sp.]|uniref:GlxA family transcriptional regulator n=1 Tax=Marinoscillum sp. TaxID=2024838 RepID=UPI0032FCD263
MNQRKIVFLILPKVHLQDLAGPAQVFYEADRLDKNTFELRYAGLQASAISEQGLQLGGLEDFNHLELTREDFIFLPGIDFTSYRDQPLSEEETRLFSWLKKQHQEGVSIASVCSGALILAKAGLLDHTRCTTHWKCVDYLQQAYPKTRVQANKIFEEDRRIYTSAGMTSGIDMALSIVETICGPLTAAYVAREMVVYVRRSGTESQKSYYLDYRTHFNPTIHQVQNYLINHINENPTLTEIAERFCVSERNLTRLFKRHAGLTIQDYKDVMRLELAAHLLHNPSYTQKYIAGECGFQDERQFRRLWKRKYNYPPSRHPEHAAY